jgi:hypothetical protein
MTEYGEEALQVAWKGRWDTEGYNGAHDGVSVDKTWCRKSMHLKAIMAVF